MKQTIVVVSAVDVVPRIIALTRQKKVINI
jgi:hypothetical protein